MDGRGWKPEYGISPEGIEMLGYVEALPREVRRELAEAIATLCRREGRDKVSCVVLGRGASDEKVDEWLRVAAPVEGFIGFAIGRSIWWDALKSYLGGGDRRASAEQIADNYQRFIKVYDEAEHGAAV